MDKAVINKIWQGYTAVINQAKNKPEVPVEKKTCSCGEIMKRRATGPTANVKERLDSGLMVKAVERYADAPRLYHERAKSADPNEGKKIRS